MEYWMVRFRWRGPDYDKAGEYWSPWIGPFLFQTYAQRWAKDMMTKWTRRKAMKYEVSCVKPIAWAEGWDD